MQPFFEWLAANAYLMLFAIVLAAVLLSRARVGGFGLDIAASALLVGAVISAIASAAGVKLGIDGNAKAIACWLFMYGLGLRIGPSLARVPRGEAARFAALALLVPALGLAGALAFARLWDLAPGAAGGLVAGSMTAPAALAAAEEALRQGVHRVPEGQLLEEVRGMIALAFVASYLAGALAVPLVCRRLPRALGIDLRAEARRQEEQSGAPGVDASGLAGLRPLAVRAFRVANERLTGCSVRELRNRRPALKVLNVLRTDPARRESAPVLVDDEAPLPLAAAGVQGTTRLRDPDTTLGGYGAAKARAAENLYVKLGAGDDVVLRPGDVLTVGGAAADLSEAVRIVGPEVADAAAINVPIDRAEIVVTNRSLEGRSLEELRTADFAGEVALHHIERGGVPLPLGLHVRLQRMDVLFVAGVKGSVDRLAAFAGRIVRPNVAAELLTLSAGMIVGLLLGSLGVRVGEARIGLGNAGGLLVAGIGVSWLLSRPALAGNAPEAARGVLEGFALATFVAIVGLDAGAYFAAHRPDEAAARILVGALFVSVLVPVIAWAVGFHVLRINPAVLVGCVSGAHSQAGPAHEAAGRLGSCVPWVGYPVAHAVSTLLIAIGGYAAMALG
jgi:putative transport protein